MKNVKKLSWGLLGLCLAFSLAFVGCKKATDGNTTDSGNDEVEGSDPEMGTGEGNENSNPVDNPTEDKDVTAVIEGAEITIAAGETVKVKADKKIEYDADLPAGALQALPVYPAASGGCDRDRRRASGVLFLFLLSCLQVLLLYS